MSSRRYSLSWLSILLLLALIPVYGVVAQDTAEPTAEPTAEATPDASGPLTYNGSVDGTIDDQQLRQLWPFTVQAADRITVRAVRTGGNLIPSVAIIDAVGNVLADSRGADETAAVALIDSFGLPAAGNYQVQVTRERGDTGLTTGDYTLFLVPVAVAADHPANVAVISPLEDNVTVEGTIAPDHWYHRYSFDADGQYTVSVAASRTSGTLQPSIDLLDSTGNVISNARPSPTGDTALIDRFTLPAAGTYTVAVTRFPGWNGITLGGYSLELDILGAGADSAALSGTAGAVGYGAPIGGELTALRWRQDWTLTTDAADALRIVAQRVDGAQGGNLQPELVLLGGSGQELQSARLDQLGDRAILDRLALSGPGTYTIRVVRAGGQNGLTTGAYTLSVTLIGAGPSAPSLAGTSGTVKEGLPSEGEITSARWVDAWTYAGVAGARVRFIAERVDGTLIPTLELRDANGQPMTSANAAETKDRATLEYQLPGTGTYQIAVLRLGGQMGPTTGTFRLTVEPVQ